MSLIVQLLIFLTTVIGITILYLKRNYNYWKNKNVASLEPRYFFGNMENPLNRKYYLGDWFRRLYDQFKSQGVKDGGFYLLLIPAYMPVDPEVIKQVMQKDFPYFLDRGFFHNETYDPLSANLFAIGGQKWRTLRTKLTPTFTSGKMKMMFDILVQCSKQLQEAIEINKDNALDIKDMLACFTTDVIGSCAFGLECNSFKNSQAEFRKHGKKIFEPMSKMKAFRNVISFIVPEFAKKMGLKIFDSNTTEFFMKVVKDTVEFREKNNVVRNDMLQILIDMKTNDKKIGIKSLTIEEIAAQAFVFFLAGFETSSTTMAFCLFELASNDDIQSKLRDEVKNVLDKHNGKLSYEAIMEMKYMDQVIDETLRKYPPLSFITRICVSDYQVPSTNVLIEKGTRVFIPIFGLHRDPEYYPNPEEFNPERFSHENKSSIKPFTYLPFGEGPRICIGQRFGLMQTKVGLTILLQNFSFSVNKQTVTPFEWDNYSFILTTKGGIWLDVKPV